MRVSARVDYAVRALAELAAAGDGPVKGDVIATRQGVPVHFLENILADLRRAGMVGSQRGSVGGYWLAVPAESVTVADVVRTVEGPLADVRGGPLEDLDYPGPAASLREVWVATRASLRAVLEQVTIADVAGGHLPEVVHKLTEAADAWVRRTTT
ncbi:MAG TPA: Rrf2 family transcriptional regulator [Acidimicrobiales bacterium]|nr:Rrf2 family transcriptional regulator [Acidimicrobiales bacterium]